MVRCLKMKIGVFDSGIGGEAVAAEIHALIPNAGVMTVNDHAHVPYGGRSKDEITALTDTAIQPLFDAGCDCIVLACNTATTNAIGALREKYPNQKFVGLEPMLKPARLLTRSQTIAVLATPATLASAQYAKLKLEWANDLTVLEPDCSTWASLIESGNMEEIDIRSSLEPLVSQGVDVIVLACTHYHWLKDSIQEYVGNTVSILEPSQAISSRIVAITG